MAFRVSFHEEAQAEFNDAIEWYEEQLPNLGERFYLAVMEAVGKIADNPTFYGICFGNYRDKALSRFPYRIVFRIINETVEIMAIFHGNRDEIKLLPRLR